MRDYTKIFRFFFFLAAPCFVLELLMQRVSCWRQGWELTRLLPWHAFLQEHITETQPESRALKVDQVLEVEVAVRTIPELLFHACHAFFQLVNFSLLPVARGIAYTRGICLAPWSLTRDALRHFRKEKKIRKVRTSSFNWRKSP
jgi:hypothetical protein